MHISHRLDIIHTLCHSLCSAGKLFVSAFGMFSVLLRLSFGGLLVFFFPQTPTSDGLNLQSRNPDLPLVELSPDILLTPEQAAAMLIQQSTSSDMGVIPVSIGGAPGQRRRTRRKVVGSRRELWDLPVVYKFSGQHG